MLGPHDPLPLRPDRLLVAGTSGSGKTTLCTRVAEATGLPPTEIDALFHGPGWTPREEFVTVASALAASPRWVVEWQYSAVRPLFLARCEVLVWLDLPVALVMWRLLRRTAWRRARRTELWNGNREGPLLGVLTERDHILRWGWRTRHTTAQRVRQACQERPELPVVRLRSPRQVSTWLEGLSGGCGTPGRAR